MKNFVLFLMVVFLTTSLIGCSKKNSDDSISMEGLNGVVSDNVVSVTDPAAGTSAEVPVYVENAEATVDQSAAAATAMAGDTAATVSKPTPKQIQEALKNAGFYNGKLDGEIGPKTKKAIEAFQSQNGLKADGKVGAKTWKSLSGFLNKTPEVANPTAIEQTVGQ